MLNQNHPLALAKSLDEYWSPRVIQQVDGYYVKVAKLKGEIGWHSHDHEDELFMVLQGCLVIEFQDKNITLNAGEVFVVPKGVLHHPIAHEECLVMLFEHETTRHTGAVELDKTRSISEQLRPL